MQLASGILEYAASFESAFEDPRRRRAGGFDEDSFMSGQPALRGHNFTITDDIDCSTRFRDCARACFQLADFQCELWMQLSPVFQ
jgi:hypothetical protein